MNHNVIGWVAHVIFIDENNFQMGTYIKLTDRLIACQVNLYSTQKVLSAAIAEAEQFRVSRAIEILEAYFKKDFLRAYSDDETRVLEHLFLLQIGSGNSLLLMSIGSKSEMKKNAPFSTLLSIEKKALHDL